MLITCSSCGATCRLPAIEPGAPPKRARCGKCKHVFTPQELAKAVPERPSGFQLAREDDSPVLYACTDEGCGWDGERDECDEDDDGRLACPECGKRARRA